MMKASEVKDLIDINQSLNINSQIRLRNKVNRSVQSSRYVSRDLSWLQFNYRVLDQAKDIQRNIFDRLKFLAITVSNLDEFFMIRVGSLYNYIDYGKKRIDYSGLREQPFRQLLLENCQEFVKDLYQTYQKELKPKFGEHGFQIAKMAELQPGEKTEINTYFDQTVFPILTPMLHDNYRSFPLLMNKTLIFGVTTQNQEEQQDHPKTSFVQIPQNLPRFYAIEREHEIVFVPIEEIIRENIQSLYLNIEILEVSLFRVTRNGDVTLEESDDIEQAFLEEIKRTIKGRKTGRVVRIEIEAGYSEWLMRDLKSRWGLDEQNIFEVPDLMDFTCLFQLIGYDEFKDKIPTIPPPIIPKGLQDEDHNIFELLQNRDILLHHPFNDFEPVLELLEKSAEDPKVLAIKITIYRLAKNSRVTDALLLAAENGKNVSVLFELKARFDEENNIREAERLEKAGCFVIYGISRFKTHTKLMLIVRKEEDKITRYVHMSSGNYNESTAKLYTDIGLLSTKEDYAQDISQFFNVITGHSQPSSYKNLVTSPRDMRNEFLRLIRQEAENARKGLESGVVMKMNSLEDRKIIDELYAASEANVPIRLIVRGICCIRPQREGLSENIKVYSLVGDFLEHSRIYYFHNQGNPKIYAGSADMMVRSFDRRLESIFLILDEQAHKGCINILDFNLRDNVNAYEMQEDGSYLKKIKGESEEELNLHEAFYHLKKEDTQKKTLFL